MIWPMAFSLAEWTCVDEDCQNKVAWDDYYPVYERGRFVGVRHIGCNE